jgi:hypothetical protein
MFNIDNYMTAEQRIELFAKDNADMRQESSWQVVDGMVYVTVKLWRTWADANPWVMGLAGESVKTQFAIEKAETSAYARAITNTGLPQYSTTVDGHKAPRANREEMVKVVADQKNPYEQKLEKRRYGSPGSRSAAVEDALRQSFEVENKQEDPQLWNIEKAVDAIGKSTPAEPPVCCSAGHILKQGVAKTGKPYYGYVCKASNKDHAKWAKMTAQGLWYFEGGE